MPTPSCRDALSREIHDPVYDPLTGRCYRNPCAAEEDGVLDWAPGCVPIEPVYGSYDSGPVDSWASEVWWDGGGGRRRRRRHHAPPRHGGGGGRFGSPRHRGLPPPHLAPPSMRTQAPGLPGQVMYPQGSGEPGRVMGGGTPIGPGRSVSRLHAQPIYAQASTTMRPTTSYHAQPQYAQASTTMRSAPMVAASRPMSVAKGMRGLGQTMAPTPLPQLWFERHFNWRPWATGWGPFILGLGAAALTPPVVAGLIAKRKTKSWRTAGLVAASVAALEVAATGGYTEWRRNHPG